MDIEIPPIVAVSKAQTYLSAITRKAATGWPTVITVNGEAVAAVVSYEAFRSLHIDYQYPEAQEPLTP